MIMRLDFHQYIELCRLIAVLGGIMPASQALRGESLVLERKRGHRTAKVRPRLWWTETPEGQVYTQIRYNKVALNIGGRGTAIEVGSLKRLPVIYRTVIRAVKAGELDTAIQVAARRSRP